ncbi:hypothetical protein CJF32_00002838 [Rutstroemia sp. NJR-2017a WRK4]|nr:hypothetical protein CJF32_00002838 [Rutstroemia sp. NJR-2017a WRK4]
MPFTLNTSASYDLSSNTSFGDSDWNRSGSYQTIKNKDGTTYTRRTQKNGGPIVEEIKRWDGMGRRVLEDGSVYEKNGKGRGWKQVQGPTVKPVESGSKSGRKKRGTILGMTTDESEVGGSRSKSGRKKRGTILGMTTDESKNVLDGSPGYGPNGWEKSKTFTKSSPVIGGTSLNGLMAKIANDALQSRGRGRIIKEVDDEEEEDSEEYTDSDEYTDDSEEYTSGEYSSEEEEEEEEEDEDEDVDEKPKKKTSATKEPKVEKSKSKSPTSGKKAATTSPTTKQKGKQATKKKPKAAKVEESSEESETADDDDDTDGYEVEEVFSSDEEREKEKEDKPEWKKPAPAPKQEEKKKPVVQRGKNTKKSVAIP